MTIGELSIMANEMGWIKDMKRANLTVIPMANWKRSYWLDKSEHPWIKPHPNIKTIRTNLSYAGFGLIEGTNLNDGGKIKFIYSPALILTYSSGKLHRLETEPKIKIYIKSDKDKETGAGTNVGEYYKVKVCEK